MPRVCGDTSTSARGEEMSSEAIEFDSAALEKKMIDDSNKAAADLDPVEVSARMYSTYAPKFLEGVKGLSSRGRARVLRALVEYPLNEKAYKHTSQLEKDMMDLGHACLEAKFLMILSTMFGSQELDDAANPDIPADLTDQEKEDLTNFMSAESVKKGLGKESATEE